MSSTLICVTQNLVFIYLFLYFFIAFFLYLFIYLFKHSLCADATAGLLVCAFVFLQTPTTLATVFRHMFHSVGQDESAHMHSLAIASTAGLYKMINFIH